jgi:SAM-dependent methyltransferase
MTWQVDWSKLYTARNEIKGKFPSIWKLPLIKKEMVLIERFLKPNLKVLEIGAGDRRMGDKIKAKLPSVDYKSFDIDTSTHQDFHNLENIDGTYDLVFGFELIEHMSPQEGLDLIISLRSHLSKNGTIILGTPNLYHPHRYFGDITHVTPYKYEELGALMILGGYEVKAFHRQFNDAFIPRMLRLYFLIWLHKWLGIDFANTVMVEARHSSLTN